MSTDSWGIEAGYEDALGRWHTTPQETRQAILRAMHVDPSVPTRPAAELVRMIRPEQTMPLMGPTDLVLEDGTVLRLETALPPDLPLGYHELRRLDGSAAIRLIVSPGRCYLPDALRTWGWAVQLYALRSAASWGIGDLADLRRLARWSATERCSRSIPCTVLASHRRRRVSWDGCWARWSGRGRPRGSFLESEESWAT